MPDSMFDSGVNENNMMNDMKTILSDQTEVDASRLIDSLSMYGEIVVAFSGGVDSSIVAAAAARADVDVAIAVTADSPSVPSWQLDCARRIAGEIGIKHRIIHTQEVTRPEYIRNDARRCYHCKETLYATIKSIVDQFSSATILSGTNADDLGDHRPGIEAGGKAGVKTPLADLGISKKRVRAIAEFFGLSNHDLPASPCLASRVAYGVEVTPERLNRIERAESWLREKGFTDLRVRLHQGELARIELTEEGYAQATVPNFSHAINAAFRQFGFRFVTIDLGGLQSGSMNRELVSLSV